MNYCNSLQIPHHPTVRCKEIFIDIGKTTYDSGCFSYCVSVNFYLQFYDLYGHVYFMEYLCS